MREWKPIETAPKDGTWVLGVVQGFVPAVVMWSQSRGRWSEFEDGDDLAYGDSEYGWELTHWMPLPVGPEELK